MRDSSERPKEVLRCISLVGICLVFLSPVAFARDTQCIVPEHAFAIRPTASYFLYEEPDIDMQIDGCMYGVIGSYTYHKKALISTSLEYSEGDLEYDGLYLISLTPVKGDTEDWLLEWRALLGLDFSLKRHLMAPFVGIGYRYWNDDLTQIEGGYRREITYWYSPVGIAFFGGFSDKWTYGISGEYDFLWHGKAETELSDLAFGLPDVHLNFSQGDGYGLRGSLWIKVQLAKHFAVSVEPFVRYWDIDQSDIEEVTFYGVPTGYIVWEPANRTTQYGLLLNLIF